MNKDHLYPHRPFSLAAETGSAIFLSVVDDFVGPSQACVNPLFVGGGLPPPLPNEQRGEGNSTTTTSIRAREAAAAALPLAVVPNVQRSRRRRRAAAAVPTSRVELGGNDTPKKDDNVNNDESKRTTATNNSSFLLTTETSGPMPSRATADPKIVTATIADCLACSGCVTTSETVLLEEQHSLVKLQEMLCLSHQEWSSRSNSNISSSAMTTTSPVVVATISPAAWADLARHLQLPSAWESSSSSSSLLLLSQLVSLLHKYLHIDAVLDGSVPLQWSLQAAAQEFCTAYQNQNNAHRRKQQHNPKHYDAKDSKSLNTHDDEVMMDVEMTLPPDELYEQQLVPSMALSASRTQYWARNEPEILHHSTAASHGPRRQQQLPLISSSCPAVTCLIEKSNHLAVPHLSRVTSAMTMATLFWNATFHCGGSTVATTKVQTKPYFHLAVMPCHDKKLEASRRDFVRENDVKDVDTVITTTELLQLLYRAIIGTSEPKFPNDERWMVRDTLLAMPSAHVHTIEDDWYNSSNTNAVVVSTVGLATTPILFARPPLPMVSCTDSSTSISSSAVNSSDNTFFELGSGGYADYIFRFAARELFGLDLTATTITTTTTTLVSSPNQPPPQPSANILWRPVDDIVVAHHPQRPSARTRNRRRDCYEAVLCRCHETGKYYVAQLPIATSVETGTNGSESTSSSIVVLRFAIAYGMQTVQRVMSDLSPSPNSSSSSSSPPHYDYIEAMACPGSCLNGGGQLRVAEREAPTETRDRIAATQQHFFASSYRAPIKPTTNGHRSNGAEAHSPAPPQVYTRYHVVPLMQHSTGAVAGVAVQDTAW